MYVNDDLEMLLVPVPHAGQIDYLNLSLIKDAASGATLVDTGLPGQAEVIGGLLAEAGIEISQLRRIILTHQDIDHIGSLAQLAGASGAQVLAHAVEVPFIDGTQLPRFARPEALEQRPQLRAVAEGFLPTHVDQALADGTRLDLAGGVRVIFTPGHTPGHLCLYLERSKALISGDALTADNGRLLGPNEGATPDLATARQSIRKLAELDVATIVCYHGGVVLDDAGGQLRRLAQSLAE